MYKPTRKCTECDANIDHLRTIAKYCSRQCVESARSKRDPARRTREARARKALAKASRTPRSCLTSECCEVIPLDAPPDRLYCSKRCRDSSYRKRVHSVRYAAGTELHASHRRASSAWKREHPIENRLSKARRDAQKRRTQVRPISARDLAARFEFYGNRCWMCGESWSHIDHVKPLAKGGPHILSNLRPACARCNQAKGDSWPL